MKRERMALGLLAALLIMGIGNARILSAKTERLQEKAGLAEKLLAGGQNAAGEKAAGELLQAYEKDRRYFRCVLNQDRLTPVEETAAALKYALQQRDRKEIQKNAGLICSDLQEMICTEKISPESIF